VLNVIYCSVAYDNC